MYIMNMLLHMYILYWLKHNMIVTQMINIKETILDILSVVSVWKNVHNFDENLSDFMYKKLTIGTISRFQRT